MSSSIELLLANSSLHLLIVSVFAALFLAGLFVIWRMTRGQIENIQREAQELRTSLAGATLQATTANEQLRREQVEGATIRTRLEQFDKVAGDLAEARAELARVSREKVDVAGDLSTARVKEADASARAIGLEERIRQTTSKFEELSKKYEAEHLRAVALDSAVSSQSVATKEQLKSASEKLQLALDAKAALTKEFETLAHRIFDEKGRKMNEQSQQGLASILGPLQERVEAFKKQVNDAYNQEARDRVALRQEVLGLKLLNEDITKEAKRLTNALQGNSQIQGTWGELVIEDILKHAGLVEGREYERQATHATDDAKNVRPDFIISLPERKHVILDSKVSLTAYVKYVGAKTDKEHEDGLAEHLQSIQRHVDELAEKSYEYLPDLNALDFVLMVVPVEGAYLAALNADKSLFERAFAKKVLIVGQVNLLATLRIIKEVWRYDNQSQIVKSLGDEAAKLYDKFVGFIESFDDVGKQLDDAKGAFQQARGRLSDGSGNVIKRMERLKELASKTKKSIPVAYLQDASMAPVDEVEDAVDDAASEAARRSA